MKDNPKRIMVKADNSSKSEFCVALHLVLSNLWEYYLEEPDKNGVAFGYVMGHENKWGSVDLNELKPRVTCVSVGNDLNGILCAEGYEWKGEAHTSCSA